MSKPRLTDAHISITLAKASCLRCDFTKWVAMHTEGANSWLLRATTALRKSAIRLPSKPPWVSLALDKWLRSSGTLLCCRSSERRVAAAKAWARLAMGLYALQAKRILSGVACEALLGFAGNLPAVRVSALLKARLGWFGARLLPENNV